MPDGLPRFLDYFIPVPLPDGEQFCLYTRFRFYSNVLGRFVEVPRLFVTDLASIPKALWNILPPWDRYGPAAVVHDWLYWSQECTRDEADLVLREGMDVLAVDPAKVTEIYEGVHLGGQHAWDHNAMLKASGYKKMGTLDGEPPYAALAA